MGMFGKPCLVPKFKTPADDRGFSLSGSGNPTLAQNDAQGWGTRPRKKKETVTR
jgi:hypothetical protein